MLGVMETSGGLQVLAKGVNGRTLCLRFASSGIGVNALKDRIQSATGIPSQLQRITAEGCELQSFDTIHAPEGVAFFCHIALRVRGGKGGFGSLLRGASAKAYQKKEDNFDACRDLSGRRIRHVNSEKQLRDWQQEASERELEQVALAHIRKLDKEDKLRAAQVREEEREEEETVIVDVSSAVEDGLQEKKRKDRSGASTSAFEGAAEKRLKLWDQYCGTIDEDEDDSDEEGNEDGEAGPSAGKVGAKRGEEGVAVVLLVDHNDGVAAGDAAGKAGSFAPSTPAALSDSPVRGAEQEAEDAAELKTDKPATVGSISKGKGSDEKVEEKAVEEQKVDGKKEGEEVKGEPPAALAIVDSEGKLKLEAASSAGDLEALGMDRLKAELQERGLKCGGSLKERAARLFLLRDTPLEKLDRKHLAPGSSGARR